MSRKTLIDLLDEVPCFASDSEERAWWETHDFSDRALAEAVRLERERRARGEAGHRPADVLDRSTETPRG